MPQLRSFSSFAGTPGIGSAYVGGLNDVTAKQAIAQRATAANLEHSAKMAALQSQQMRDAQELAVQKAYQDQMLGLKAREVDAGIQEAADKFAFDQAQRNANEALFAGGATDVANAPGYKSVWVSPNQRQILQTQKSNALDRFDVGQIQNDIKNLMAQRADVAGLALSGKSVEDIDAQIEEMRKRARGILSPNSGGASLPQSMSEANPMEGKAETLRLDKNGRRAVFDTETKKFLRYLD